MEFKQTLTHTHARARVYGVVTGESLSALRAAEQSAAEIPRLTAYQVTAAPNSTHSVC